MDFIQLLGASDVQSAGYNMKHAAETMARAASQIDEALQQHSRKMDELIEALRESKEGSPND